MKSKWFKFEVKLQHKLGQKIWISLYYWKYWSFVFSYTNLKIVKNLILNKGVFRWISSKMFLWLYLTIFRWSTTFIWFHIYIWNVSIEILKCLWWKRWANTTSIQSSIKVLCSQFDTLLHLCVLYFESKCLFYYIIP